MSNQGSEATLTYSSYLHVDQLLALQERRSTPPEHDEMLFIVVHQVYELWFKQILHEVGFLQSCLESGDTATSLDTFQRIRTIFKTMVGQVDVLETMTPVSFSSFRSRLEKASGFQSVQFRELEIVLGKRDPRILAHFKTNSKLHDRLIDRLGKPTLFDSFLRHLALRGYAIPEELLQRDFHETIPASPRLRATLIGIYRDDPAAASVCERLVDLDEGLQEWRYRHVKMVERTIGALPGTGGSSGAAYLRTTLFTPLFPDLWAIRSEL